MRSTNTEASEGRVFREDKQTDRQTGSLTNKQLDRQLTDRKLEGRAVGAGRPFNKVWKEQTRG